MCEGDVPCSGGASIDPQSPGTRTCVNIEITEGTSSAGSPHHPHPPPPHTPTHTHFPLQFAPQTWPGMLGLPYSRLPQPPVGQISPSCHIIVPNWLVARCSSMLPFMCSAWPSMHWYSCILNAAGPTKLRWVLLSPKYCTCTPQNNTGYGWKGEGGQCSCSKRAHVRQHIVNWQRARGHAQQQSLRRRASLALPWGFHLFPHVHGPHIHA